MAKRENTPGALPIYQQVSELLIREIAAGRLLDGQRLPPERAMAAEHGVTVRTLRKALAELTGRGLLDRRHGSGNYVRVNDDVRSIYSMFRLELSEGGGLPTARLLSLEAIDRPADLPADFATTAAATRIRRLRLLNGIAIAVEEIWLDGRFGTLKTEDLSDSLYQTYRGKLGFWITRASDQVGLGQAPVWSPEGFDPPPGATVGFVERLSWAQAEAPVEFSRTWFDPVRARYVQRIS
ncbi:MAG: GntR family transcriptional regulator [Pseudomonadota bacterium]|nr:GntR family transcriptional regulator [Pseudomonadota bacterium]